MATIQGDLFMYGDVGMLLMHRLVENATAMGANAVLMMRYDSAEIGNTMSEIVASGTAAPSSVTSWSGCPFTPP